MRPAVEAPGRVKPAPRSVTFAPGPWPELRATAEWRPLLALCAGAATAAAAGPRAAAVLDRSTCLQAAIARRRAPAVAAAAAALAGLGEGSTPAGDDYLMGTLHALWALGGDAVALAPAIGAAAARRTTTVSGGWLLAASRGGVGPAWGDLLRGLAAVDAVAVRAAAAAVRALGHTSGRFSLRGFLDTLEVPHA